MELCNPRIVDGRRRWVSQAVQALSASSKPFYTSFVCTLGPLSRAASVHGPYLEHVVRAGSTLAAAQRSRPCSTIFLCVTHNYFAVNASGTLPGSPMNIFGANRAPGGAGEEENEFLWNCDIPGAGKGLR